MNNGILTAWRQSPTLRIVLTLLVTALVLFFLCLLFPYTGDDWAWGSSIGMKRLANGFADYNGRYLGDLVVIALTRNIYLRSAVMAVVLTLIAYEIYAFTEKKRPTTYLVALTLLLLVPVDVGAQGIVWTAGFSNYAISTLLVLVYLNHSKYVIDGSSDVKPRSNIACIGFFLLGACNALFIENVTVFNIVIGVIAIVYSYKGQKHLDKWQIAFLAGALVGACIMFSNSNYGLLFSGESSTQELPDNVFVTIARRCGAVLPYYLSAYNGAIFAVMLVALALPAIGNRQLAESQRALLARLRLPVIFLVLLVMSLCFSFLLRDEAGIAGHIVAIAMALVYAGALVALARTYRSSALGKTIVVVVICIAILVAPYLVVSPVGPRNFLVAYALEAIIACTAWDELVDDGSPAIKVLVSVVLAIVLVRWFVVYGEIHDADSKRTETVREAVEAGEKSVTVDMLPHSECIHTGDPTNGIWETRYKLFYGIPKDFEIILQGEEE